MSKKENKFSKDLDDMKTRYKTHAEEQKEFEERGPSDWSGYVLGLNLLVSVLVCSGIGVLLDKFFETGGLMVVLFVILGFSAGMWQLWKKVNKGDVDADDQEDGD
jgi:F0F1-type ATP synthase assembly protein I